MANDKKGEQSLLVKLLTDYRVIVLIICLLVATLFIAPTLSGSTNLKFGLDFEGGSWLKMKLISNETIDDQTLDLTKSIMERKVNAFGLKDVPIKTARDDANNAYILMDFAGLTYQQAMDLVGTPGKFEMKIYTQGNQTELIMDGSDVKGISPPSYLEEYKGYVVPISFSSQGMQKFSDAVRRNIAYYNGISQWELYNNTANHKVAMYLDGKMFWEAPVAEDMVKNIYEGGVQDNSIFATLGGNDDKAKATGQMIYIQMSSGSLPVNVEVVSSGQVPAEQGAMFKTVVILAAILAQGAIGLIMYLRYREPRIILPMFLTSLFEIYLLLGFAAFARWEIDLPSVAAIIAVIGTGVDQLIIITDEVLTTGKTPTTKKILQKMSQAFKIIVTSAATVVVAMVPLMFFGFGALNGFALTTIVGVAIGILITRPAYGRIISDILNK